MAVGPVDAKIDELHRHKETAGIATALDDELAFCRWRFILFDKLLKLVIVTAL